MDRLVDFGFAADDFEIHALASFGGQVTNQARVFSEEFVEWLHSCSHDRDLDVAGDAIERTGCNFDLFDELRVSNNLGNIFGHCSYTVFLENKLANKVHQRFKA